MEKEIIEGNKLIAEFMGLVAYNEKGHPYEYGYYHQRWDYLMEVVEKIEAPGNFPDKTIKEGADFIIYCGNCSVNYSDDDREYNHTHPEACSTRIEAVWKSVILFIEWFNEQTK